MKIDTYHVDTFTTKQFSGNPAAVCILENWLPDDILQKIAVENNQPATTFLVHEKNEIYVRWFAPDYEIDLCGHGSLAAGFVLFNLLDYPKETIILHHPSAGVITISRNKEFICLNFPIKNLEVYTSSTLIDGLGIKAKCIYQHKKERILVVLNSEKEVRLLKPNIELLKQLEHRGIIVTAKSDEVDFVSRVFYPKKSIYEDSVTGSSFCLLAPYWANELHKTKLWAKQLSTRGGDVTCERKRDGILLYGQAVLYMKGMIYYN